MSTDTIAAKTAEELLRHIVANIIRAQTLATQLEPINANVDAIVSAGETAETNAALAVEKAAEAVAARDDISIQLAQIATAYTNQNARFIQFLTEYVPEP